MQKKWKIVHQITRGKKLSAQWIPKTLKDLTLSTLFKKVQRKLKMDDLSLNERNYLLNGLQNLLKDFLCFMFSKS